MATERLSMRRTKDILRLKWLLLRSHRQVAASAGVAISTVSETLHRAQVAGLDWPAVDSMSEAELEARLYPVAEGAAPRPMPEMTYLHTELRRKAVTLQLLHLEYLEQHPDGYGYSHFCEFYRRWRKAGALSMRQVHRAGEKAFVDYSGKKPHIIDERTGEAIEVELFVAVLGASSYTFAEATRSQRGPDFITSHIRALAFFDGVPEMVVPDQLKSGVTKACRYEPGIQRTYEELAEHYGTAILPARPRKPRDKAKVEVAVQVVQRWIIARLRNQRFFSLEALNERIAELLIDLNDRPMRATGKSRRELFETIDRPALKPLPSTRFGYGDWLSVSADIDYHVDYDQHAYSIPYTLRADPGLELRATPTTVEVFLRGDRIAAHARSYERGGKTTLLAHMPKSHRAHAEWSPSRILGWAETIGVEVESLCRAILEERAHLEQAYRSCLGIMRLERTYGADRLRAACARALVTRARTYRSVAETLQRGLDRLPLPSHDPQESPCIAHEHIRGRDYYN